MCKIALFRHYRLGDPEANKAATAAITHQGKVKA